MRARKTTVRGGRSRALSPVLPLPHLAIAVAGKRQTAGTTMPPFRLVWAAYLVSVRDEARPRVEKTLKNFPRQSYPTVFPENVTYGKTSGMCES
jgi:hypothetical protein